MTDAASSQNSRLMTNFSRSDYSSLLAEFRAAGYRSIGFPEAHKLDRFDEPWLLLRHDVDFCPRIALEMARLEAEQGFFATYFFMARTPLYNPLTPENTAAIQETLRMGHRLGLHFDQKAYGARADVQSLAAGVRREAKALGDWFEAEVQAVSYHRPGAREQSGGAEGTFPYLNACMPEFTKKMAYLSDPQGVFMYGHPLEHEAFKSRRPMQLLTHSIWWGKSAITPLAALQQYIAERNDEAELFLARNCKPYRVGRFAGVTD